MRYYIFCLSIHSQAYPSWKTAALYNQIGAGQQLVVHSLSVPTRDLQPSAAGAAMANAPMTAVYATVSNSTRLTVFVLSRKLDNFTSNLDCAYTPVLLRLPLLSVETITLYNMTGSPRLNNLDGDVVQIASKNISATNFSRFFRLDSITGVDARGISPAGLMAYVFDGVQFFESVKPQPILSLHFQQPSRIVYPTVTVRFLLSFDQSITWLMSNTSAFLLTGTAPGAKILSVSPVFGTVSTEFIVVVSGMIKRGSISIKLRKAAVAYQSSAIINEESQSSPSVYFEVSALAPPAPVLKAIDLLNGTLSLIWSASLDPAMLADNYTVCASFVRGECGNMTMLFDSMNTSIPYNTRGNRVLFAYVTTCNAAACNRSNELSILSFSESFSSYPVFVSANASSINAIPTFSSRIISKTPYDIGVQIAETGASIKSPTGSQSMLRMSGYGEGYLVFNNTADILANLSFYTVTAVIGRGLSNDYDVMGLVLHFLNTTNNIRITFWSNPPRSNTSNSMKVYVYGDPSYGSFGRGVISLMQHGDFWTLSATTALASDGRSIELFVQLLNSCGNSVLDPTGLINGRVWRVGTLRSIAPLSGAFGVYGSVNAGGGSLSGAWTDSVSVSPTHIIDQDPFVNPTDPCRVQNGGCAHICSRTFVGRCCRCHAGYSLLATDKQSCVDINECSVNNGGCSHICNNSNGSFSCACPAGFFLSADNRTCNDINECETNNGGCQHRCTNTQGSWNCSCDSGFEASFNPFSINQTIGFVWTGPSMLPKNSGLYPYLVVFQHIIGFQ